MEYISYIIVALIPASAVIVIAYILLKKNNQREINAQNLALRGERQKSFLEPRTEAYQRLTLLMERINPNNLIMRLDMEGKNAALFQAEILNNIRTEYDHNVVQQMFVSEAVWELILRSKEETIKIINVAAQQLKSDASALDLASQVFTLLRELEELPTEIALKALRKEFQRLF